LSSSHLDPRFGHVETKRRGTMARMLALGAVIGLRSVSAALLRSQASAPTVTSFDLSCFMKDEVAPLETGGAKGRSYRGLASSTVSGRTCQKWTANHPWPEPALMTPTKDVKSKVDESDPNSPESIVWGNGLGNHNYCRNPDSSLDSPWCYTLDDKELHKKELCEIPECPAHPRDFGVEAGKLATDVQSKDCQCMDQLYGSSRTTAKTAVKLSLAAGKHQTGIKTGGPGCKCPGSR